MSLRLKKTNSDLFLGSSESALQITLIFNCLRECVDPSASVTILISHISGEVLLLVTAFFVNLSLFFLCNNSCVSFFFSSDCTRKFEVRNVHRRTIHIQFVNRTSRVRTI